MRQAPGLTRSRNAASRKDSRLRRTQPDFANSPLPAAMLAVAHDDSPQNRQMLYQSMLQTWFVVPTKEAAPDKPGFSAVPANVADSLSLEHDSSGQPVAVAFTDEEALRNWHKTIPWIALQGTAFFQAVASTEAEEIVINPYEPENPESKMIRPGGIVKRWEFEELAEGRIPEKQTRSETANGTAKRSGHHATSRCLPRKCSMRLAKWPALFLKLRPCISDRSSIRMENRIGRSLSSSPERHQTNI